MEGYFGELDVVTNKIIELVKKDTELCKYLYYDDTNPLSHSDFNHNLLMFSKIFPLPKQPDAQLTKGTILDIYFASGKPCRDNSSFKKEIIIFDIICNLDTWKTEFGLRPNLISNRIDFIFNNKYIPDISMNYVYFNGWAGMQFSDLWYGYRLSYMITNNSNVGAGVE